MGKPNSQTNRSPWRGKRLNWPWKKTPEAFQLREKLAEVQR
jgi:hypothetical protein